ncbi:MAG TPA: VOC family protein [Firmicutes bacterium]|nr:VOC family protein [Bacillota bacterium]
MNLGITGLEHVAVQVADLERSLAFYTGTLGLILRERAEIPERGLRKALLAVGTGQIELLEYAGKAVPRADGPVTHLALAVADVAAALAALKAAGATLEDETPRTVGGGCRIAFLRGPDGEHIELFQPPGA